LKEINEAEQLHLASQQAKQFEEETKQKWTLAQKGNAEF
jgi:hypothetical protein